MTLMVSRREVDDVDGRRGGVDDVDEWMMIMGRGRGVNDVDGEQERSL